MRITCFFFVFIILFAENVNAETAMQQQVVIKVNGMFCPFCTAGIEKRLKALPETETVKSDLAAGEVIVTLKPGAKYEKENFEDAIKRAGFTHSGISLQSLKK